MLVSLVSAKGAPGVTTLAVGLAARWPQGEAVLLEADPAGGDLSPRFGIAPDRGLAAMALAARHTGQELEPASWLQRLPCGVEAVLAATGASASASLSALTPCGGDLLRRWGASRSVVVDAGRWWPESPATPLVAACDVVLLVAQPKLDDIHQCQARVSALAAHCRDVRLLLVGEGPWPASEIAAAVGAPLAAVMPYDRRGAGVLGGDLVPRWGWDSRRWWSWTKLPLLRACHSLAQQLMPARSFAPTAQAPIAGNEMWWGPAGQRISPVSPVVGRAEVPR